MRTASRSLLFLTVALLFSASAGQCAAPTAPSLSIAPISLGNSAPNAMTVDAQGNVYLAGTTNGYFQTTPSAFQTQPGSTCILGFGPPMPFGIGPVLILGPCPSAFVAKLSISAGAATVVWATLFGGAGSDSATGIAVDPGGNVYITGITNGTVPTTAGSLEPDLLGPGVFLAKFNPQGSQLLYSTYLPGLTVPPSAIAADAAGNAYITGNTRTSHIYVEKLGPHGPVLLYTKMLAGVAGETSTAITIDAAGNAYVTGFTLSLDFPVTPGAFQTKLNGSPSAFVAKLDPQGNISYATYLGGSGSSNASTIQVDSEGYTYVAGNTSSLDFPTTPGAWEPQPVVPLWSYRYGPGGFVAKLSPAGDALAFSSYVFADGFGVTAMTPDGTGGAYLAGTTAAGVAVTPSAPQPCFSGASNLYVVHLGQNGALADRTYVGGPIPVGLPRLGLGFAGGVLYLATANEFFQLQFGGPDYVPAPCLSPDVLNAATFLNAGQVAPGELVSLTGLGIGPEVGVGNQLSAEGTISTELSGVHVFFDNTPAPLLYVQSQQINAIAPFELAGQTSTTVRVEYQGVTSSATGPVGVASPGIFQAGIANQDDTLNSPSNPAKIGSIISLYGTGFGQTNPPGVTGSLFPLFAAPLVPAAMMPLQVVIGGVSAQILYAGAAPGRLAGIDQLNVVVPATPPLLGAAVSLSVSSAVHDPVPFTLYVKP